MYVMDVMGARRVRIAVGARPVRVIQRGDRTIVLLRPRLARLFGLRAGGLVSVVASEHGGLQLRLVRGVRTSARFDARLPAARARTAGRAKRA